MLGMIAAGLVNGIAGAALADPIQVAVSTNPNSYGVAEIKVDGPNADGVYTEVLNETLDYIVSVRGDRPKKATGNGELEIQFKNESPLDNGWSPSAVIVHGDVTPDWKSYKVSAPYADPWSGKVANQRVSPIKFCNDNLAIRKKDNRREETLKKGFSFTYHDAYKLRGYVRYPMKGSAYFGNDSKDYDDVQAIPVKITCLALDRPRVRTQTSTQGVDPKPGQKMKPTISEVSFKIGPAQIEKMGKFLCPTQLRLYGRLETIRDFTGKSIFVGPYYLSPITEIQMAKAGNRNMVGTYMMKWHEMGGKAIAPDAEPKKQSLTFKFNVSNKDGKVLESVEKSIQVACARIKTNVPAVDGGMTVAPAN
jgi:hypothetical protein